MFCNNYCSWDRYWGHASKVLAIFSPVFVKVSKLDSVSLLFLKWQIAHFTVTGENKAGVDFGLIQLSLLYYVNQLFLMLTTYFSAYFPQEKEGGFNQNKVTLSLMSTQRLGY